MTSIRPWAMRLAVLACASIAPHFAAHASGTAQASLSGLSFTLIDLAPDDDLAPSFTLLSKGLDSGAYLSAFAAVNAWDNVKHQYVPLTQGQHDNAGTLLNASVETANATAQSGRTPAGVMSASSQLSTPSLDTPSVAASSSMRLSDGQLTSELLESLGIPSSGELYLPVTLSANTRLVVTAQASVQAQVNHDNPIYTEYQKATANLQLLNGVNDTLSKDEIMAFDDDERLSISDVPVFRSLNRQLTVSFDNTGPLSQRLQLVAELGTTSSAMDLRPPPVPEPATWAQMALGATLMALAMRRKSGKP